MSKHYKHLSKEERDRLAILKGQGRSIRAIAAQLGRSPSTVSRELHRNADHGTSGTYLPHQAQAKADLRWKQSHRRPRLKSSFLRHYVRVKLKRGWSPEQIAGLCLPNNPSALDSNVLAHRVDIHDYAQTPPDSAPCLAQTPSPDRTTKGTRGLRLGGGRIAVNRQLSPGWNIW